MSFTLGVVLPTLGAHITEKKFLAMWKIEDLEWRDCLAYSIISSYIQYNEPKGYGVLKFTVGCLGLYALRYYCRLEIEYCS
jgi:hypothetical protein